MKRISYCVLVLVICLITVPRQTEGLGGRKGQQNVTEVIEQVCGKTDSKEVCVKTLKADPLVRGRANVTAKDLAISFLRMASKNATGVIYELKVLMENDRLGPQVQQGLSDCRDMLSDAADQIEIALSAISANATYNTKEWLQVATDATELCKASLEGNEQVMLTKANGFYDLCVIASGICSQL
ncbi:uncharacterized protein LOC129305647 [Prosopis cineraria]|uniref:uncharacterized protein LOC129305647 n=1 Tax=Prosopis cineraria TaxID=364024 RepID=UPI00240F35E9|nr:uncharacterized protein LOC129305647 [Prosopis cineraria]